MPKASAAETSASNRLSVSNCQMMRRRDAPIASRMPISRWRATARASSRLATFAHPIIRMRPNAKKSGMNSQHDVGRQRDRALPRFEHEARRGPLAGTFSRTLRVPHAELRERLAARQTGLQPPDDAGGRRSVSRPASAAAELVKERERRPEVRRSDRLESSKAFRHHADNVERRAVHAGPCGRERRDRPQNAGTRRDG